MVLVYCIRIDDAFIYINIEIIKKSKYIFLDMLVDVPVSPEKKC